MRQATAAQPTSRSDWRCLKCQPPGSGRAVARDDLDDASEEILADELVPLDETLNDLFGRSRRNAAELAAILIRLEQLKVEIRLHKANLASRRPFLQPVADPEPDTRRSTHQHQIGSSEAA